MRPKDGGRWRREPRPTVHELMLARQRSFIPWIEHHYPGSKLNLEGQTWETGSFITKDGRVWNAIIHDGHAYPKNLDISAYYGDKPNTLLTFKGDWIVWAYQTHNLVFDAPWPLTQKVFTSHRFAILEAMARAKDQVATRSVCLPLQVVREAVPVRITAFDPTTPVPSSFRTPAGQTILL